jgi:hypothetical protein
MHIIRNIYESLVGMLLNIQGKIKDGVNARKDMVAMKIRLELAPQKHEKRNYLPQRVIHYRRRRKLVCWSV